MSHILRLGDFCPSPSSPPSTRTSAFTTTRLLSLTRVEWTCRIHVWQFQPHDSPSASSRPVKWFHGLLHAARIAHIRLLSTLLHSIAPPLEPTNLTPNSISLTNGSRLR